MSISDRHLLYSNLIGQIVTIMVELVINLNSQCIFFCVHKSWHGSGSNFMLSCTPNLTNGKSRIWSTSVVLGHWQMMSCWILMRMDWRKWCQSSDSSSCSCFAQGLPYLSHSKQFATKNLVCLAMENKRYNALLLKPIDYFIIYYACMCTDWRKGSCPGIWRLCCFVWRNWQRWENIHQRINHHSWIYR